ncbi:hypothetical protein Bpfe_001179 [Biomphalaria pfeifferi]|uniref:Uncharacterized protein n=1 Tax=Biomphalaria pfeifferi TaxID=112525 RepID=A0AAD8CBX9_BIOPF|nr:hypothetical protein Bpfe_001179 [Biomphalaria pfeifferi]
MDQTHLEEWSTTECIYNERINKIHNRTLLYLKGALLQEIEGNTDTEEKIFKLNFLSWLEYKLNNFSAAKTRTDEVLRLTNSTNLTALIGKVKILYKLKGNDNLEATKKTLKELLSERLAEDAKIDSRAQLAYCYCRLGGAAFLKRSISIFEDLLKRQPINDYWNLSLGIAHYTAWTTSPSRRLKGHLNEAAKLLTGVINTSNNSLFVRLAYRRMLSIKRYSDKYNTMMLAKKVIFQLPLRKLVDEILKIGVDDAKTLSMLAETLRANCEVDRAIQLLQKSLKLKEMSKTYHFLGKCYEEKGYNNFEKPKESYEKSIQLSETNFTAICDYDKFLMLRNLEEECLTQFRKMTDTVSCAVTWQTIAANFTILEMKSAKLVLLLNNVGDRPGFLMFS